MLDTCDRCDYRHPSRGEPGAPLVDGTYSPSGFVVLSSGELECPECEGTAEDEAEDPCERCAAKGVIPCPHAEGASR